MVGVVLIFVGRFDFKRLEERKRTQNMNNIVVALIFTITVVNIFIATFGIDDERTTFMRWTKDQESMTTPRPRLPSELDPWNTYVWFIKKYSVIFSFIFSIKESRENAL